MRIPEQTAIAAARGREAYRQMRLIRRFEERVIELVNANEIAGVTHEYIGEEAIAVGVCSALQPGDVITSTHRGHGHIIAKGGEVRRMMAELYGRVTGYNRGKGGSMHIADLSLGIYGANGIVAAGVPIAAGAAWAAKLRKTGAIAVAFFGDGGANQGVLHETMNLAGIWKLPMLFVCENNQYAVTTSVSYATAGPGIAHRASAYGFPGYAIDGMDVEQVMTAADAAVSRARSGEGPTLLECKAYRFQGHFTAERALRLTYRSVAEIEEWRTMDPLVRWARKLEERGELSSEDRDSMDRDIERLLEEAALYARSSAWPAPEETHDHMYGNAYPGLPVRGSAWTAN
ncbi:MAG TPA: thiamine pyrophosphate-dependent dehydrogenase E1 component subunit alpha [Bryobacteraceae bacterium]|nr:thiamine pyrophosphate-dependent dehydrogenase E1 component subunit alpha [Bryobacteraceae bacterium]